jgi:hypothetical protein
MEGGRWKVEGESPKPEAGSREKWRRGENEKGRKGENVRVSREGMKDKEVSGWQVSFGLFC